MTATRKILAPATGDCKWVGHAANGLRLLEITPTGGESQTYEVAPVTNGYDLHNLTHTARTNAFVCYHIRHWDRSVYTCDCPDATNRKERRTCCKHIKGLLAALKSEPF